jgi:hypothetical protein
LILTALGAATLSIGLGVGATLATGNPTPSVPTSTTTMMGGGNGNDMHDGTGMGPMMGSAGMDADDMTAGNMTAMHTTMRAAMNGSVSADQLAACDSAHTSMMAGSSPMTSDTNMAHAAHHQGIQP